VALVALLLFLVLRAERRTGEDQAIIHQATIALAQGKAYRHRLAILKDAAQRAQGRATVAIASDRAKDAEIRRLQLQLATDTSSRDSLTSYRQLVDTLTSQRDSARSANAFLLLRVSADSARAEAAEARANTLETHLRAVLTVADCHVLGAKWLPRCPSRTASAVMGLGTGVAATLILHP